MYVVWNVRQIGQKGRGDKKEIRTRVCGGRLRCSTIGNKWEERKALMEGK
jgi:hypothetical protein